MAIYNQEKLLDVQIIVTVLSPCRTSLLCFRNCRKRKHDPGRHNGRRRSEEGSLILHAMLGQQFILPGLSWLWSTRTGEERAVTAVPARRDSKRYVQRLLGYERMLVHQATVLSVWGSTLLPLVSPPLSSSLSTSSAVVSLVTIFGSFTVREWGFCFCHFILYLLHTFGVSLGIVLR